MGRKYRNPPLIEVVCEFHFEPSREWDLTAPGLIYDRIKDSFPEKKQTRRSVVSRSASSEAALDAEPRIETVERMQFRKPDQSAMVQVSTDFLAVHHFRPYCGWDGFTPLVRQALAAYENIVEPAGLRRISLRYVDRFDFSENPIALEHYLHFTVNLAPGLPGVGTFFIGVETPGAAEEDNLRLELTNIAAQPPAVIALLMTMTYSRTPDEVPMPLTAALDWLGGAHDHIQEIFEATITPKLRATFGGDIEADALNMERTTSA